MGHYDVVDLLLEHVATVNQCALITTWLDALTEEESTGSKMSPLLAALISHSTQARQLCQRRLSAGADPNIGATVAIGGDEQETPLMMATLMEESESVELVALLLENGADPRVRATYREFGRIGTPLELLEGVTILSDKEIMDRDKSIDAHYKALISAGKIPVKNSPFDFTWYDLMMQKPDHSTAETEGDGGSESCSISSSYSSGASGDSYFERRQGGDPAHVDHGLYVEQQRRERDREVEVKRQKVELLQARLSQLETVHSESAVGQG
ncbi:hypothetical protein GE09DRAFT_1162683, partial [Coniochaeta sp. 2T2.1]